MEEDVVVFAEAAEVVEVELPAGPPPYCARANGNRESKSGLLENCIFQRF